MKKSQSLPCGIPSAEHKICWEKNCYLSGEGCPVHKGAKKSVMHHIPDYVHESVLVNGKRVFIGPMVYFPSKE